jgi:hypothetical protein
MLVFHLLVTLICLDFRIDIGQYIVALIKLHSYKVSEPMHVVGYASK